MASLRDDVGYTRLQGELGAATPAGSNVVVSQVEGAASVNGESVWMPDPTLGDFIGKTFTSVTANPPPGVYSGHATAVAVQFVGNSTALAHAIDAIYNYNADAWLGADFLYTFGVRQPSFSSSRVVNHSWVGDAGSANAEILRRLDYVIETDDQVHVVGMNNGSGTSTYALLASAFNTIAAGTTSGMHQVGSVAVDSDYVAGRIRPDLVAPGENVSLATARISSAAAVLVETGHADAALSTDNGGTSFINRAGLLIRNAERTEVIRAALMAGADRVTRNTTSPDLPRYRDTIFHQSTNGLDTRFGAGQVNVYNSYMILASGEQNSQEDGGIGSGTSARGWDYDRAFGGSGSTNSNGTYALPTAPTPQLLTAALVWNLDINGGTASNFNRTAYRHDLNLLVLDVSDPLNPATVYASQSSVDNTENAWLVVPANAQYALRVARAAGSATFNQDYGVAWQLLPDSDADGAHDGQDNCIAVANGPMAPDAGGNSQLDADGDGYGNACDGDLNNSGFIQILDYDILRGVLNQSATSSPAAAAADLNGSGAVTILDYDMMRGMLNTAPGPSAYAP